MFSLLRKWRRREDDLREELEAHLEELGNDRLSEGLTPEEAGRAARLKLGNFTALQEAVHETGPFYLFERLARDLQVAARTFLRYRGVYLSAICILALGIGMSVAMFSLVEAVLIRPLPFPGQDSIEVIWKADPLAGTHVEELAYPELRDIQQRIPDFESAAVMPTSLYGYGRVLQRHLQDPVEIESAPVSHDFFRVLGVPPVIGRDFSDSDERVGAAPVVILSDRIWREDFGADRNIVGQLVRLNGQGHTVIGVMGPGVEFPRGAGLWVPLGVEQRLVERRGNTFLQAIARRKQGRSHDDAAREVNALFKSLAADYPQFYSASQQAVVTPLVEYWTGSARLHLLIMLSAALLLLAAATISSGNLLLSRTLTRQSEFATRLALGAGRGQIFFQLAIEGTLVAVVAAIAGLLIAHGAIRFLISTAPADIPRLSESALDLSAFLVAAGAATAAALFCSLIAGWSTMRMDLEAALRAGGARSSMSRGNVRTRQVFILSQSAVTVMLLSMAALFVSSYRAMVLVDTGFRNRDTLSMNLTLRGPGVLAGQAFDSKYRQSFYARLLTRLRESPGVVSAAAVLVRPLEGAIGWDRSYEFEFEAGQKDRAVLPKANFEVVTPQYFETVGTALIEGRDFDEHDTGDSESVVIISRELARHVASAGHAALGSRIRLGGDKWSKVIGVSADARYRDVTKAGVDIFVPYLQAQGVPANYLVLRGTQQANDLNSLVRRSLAEMDPAQAISGEATLGDLIDRNTARHRFNVTLLIWFAICAAVLVAGAVYSVVAETVAARRQELSIRVALGAGRTRLILQFVSGTVGIVLAGELLGIFFTATIGSIWAGLLYGVSPRDPAVFGSVSVFVFGVSLAAGLFPVLAATRQSVQALLRTN